MLNYSSELGKLSEGSGSRSVPEEVSFISTQLSGRYVSYQSAMIHYGIHRYS
jgi:hypothetical protein